MSIEIHFLILKAYIFQKKNTVDLGISFLFILAGEIIG